MYDMQLYHKYYLIYFSLQLYSTIFELLECMNDEISTNIFSNFPQSTLKF